MADGASLFFDAAGQLWARKGAVLPILAVPLGILLILEVWVYTTESEAVWPYVLYFAVSFVIGPWIAIFWHRYILLEETASGLMPPWRNRLVWPYVLAGLLIVLVIWIILAALLILALFAFPELEDTDVFWAIMVGLVVAISFVPGLYLSFRLGLVLPHLALERGWLGFRESWHKTSGMGAGLWVLTALYTLVLSLPALLPVFEEGAGSLPISLISALIYVISTLIGISILTRLYEYSGLMAPEHGEIL